MNYLDILQTPVMFLLSEREPYKKRPVTIMLLDKVIPLFRTKFLTKNQTISKTKYSQAFAAPCETKCSSHIFYRILNMISVIL